MFLAYMVIKLWRFFFILGGIAQPPKLRPSGRASIVEKIQKYVTEVNVGGFPHFLSPRRKL